MGRHNASQVWQRARTRTRADDGTTTAHPAAPVCPTAHVAPTNAVAVAGRPTPAPRPAPRPADVAAVEPVHHDTVFLDVWGAPPGPEEDWESMTAGPIGRCWDVVYRRHPWILIAIGGVLLAVDVLVIYAAAAR